MENAVDGGTIGTRRRAVPVILAVDDSRSTLNALAHRLGHLGHLVVLSDRGTEALDLIAGRGFDLVLVAARLSDMSGMHVLSEIRGSRETVDLPVIMLADRENGTGTAALAAGADDYCVKPFDFEILAARVERTLARAGRIEELKRLNLALDARIAARAIELGEVRGELAATRADRSRLAASVRALHDQLGRSQAA